MKKSFVLLLCLSLSGAVTSAQDPKQFIKSTTPLPRMTDADVTNPPAPVQTPTVTPDPNAGKFKFEEETHDFGEVVDGEKAEYDFEFKNVGKKPIIISEAHASCGCTVPSWPKEPILPKHKGVIHVSYNTAGRVGPISKDVIITSNALQNPMKLHITGSVKAKPEELNKPAPIVPPPPAPPIR